jgi:hypothetical protein
LVELEALEVHGLGVRVWGLVYLLEDPRRDAKSKGFSRISLEIFRHQAEHHALEKFDEFDVFIFVS